MEFPAMYYICRAYNAGVNIECILSEEAQARGMHVKDWLADRAIGYETTVRALVEALHLGDEWLPSDEADVAADQIDDPVTGTGQNVEPKDPVQVRDRTLEDGGEVTDESDVEIGSSRKKGGKKGGKSIESRKTLKLATKPGKKIARSKPGRKYKFKQEYELPRAAILQESIKLRKSTDSPTKASLQAHFKHLLSKK